MSIKYGPDIVKSNLTCLFDSVNVKSYPGSGNTWTDLSGNGNNATKSGGVSYNSGYMSFDGSGYFYTDTSKVTVNKTAYTKMAFIYVTNFNYSNNIISGGTDAHAFWLGGGNTLKMGHNGSWYLAQTTTTMSLNQWYFVAGTFNTTDGYKVYHNGVLEGSSNNVNTWSTSANDTYIGAFSAANNFSGKINNVMVYNRALTDSEIMQNFNALRGRYSL